jgi:acetyl esterase
MVQSGTTVVLEPAAQEVVRRSAQPPFAFQLPPDQTRERLDQMQAGNVARPEADIEDVLVPGGPTGQVRVRIVRPLSPGRPAQGGGLRKADRGGDAQHGYGDAPERPNGLPTVLYSPRPSTIS